MESTLATVSDAILSWYTGKGKEKAQAALVQLNASIQQGFWAPGVSRGVKSALSKSNLGTKVGKELDGNWSEAWRCRPLSSLIIDIRYGCFRSQSVDFADLAKRIETEIGPLSAGQTAALAAAAKWATAFGPIGHAVHVLDSTRPKPVFTSVGVSPTLTKTLADLNVEGNPETIQVCPMKWELVDRVLDAKGTIGKVWVGTLLWPAGTKHDTSRHSGNAATGWGHRKCHACGHAIKNPYNWVPLLLTGRDDVKKSLWVGRDCAKSLFGVDMTGELELNDSTRDSAA